MRKIIVSAVIAACMVSFTAPAYSEWKAAHYPRPTPDKADAARPCGDCLTKLGRGFLNCLTFIMEVPSQISKVSKCNGPLAGFTWGVVKGVGMAGVRAGVGIYEVVTFPLACPAGYGPILNDPEYFFADEIE